MQLVVDLQGELFGSTVQDRLRAVPVYARARQTAVDLARAAIEAHETEDSAAIAGRVRRARRRALADRLEGVAGRLKELLDWVPSLDRRRLGMGLFPRQCELPHVVYVAFKVGWAAGRARVSEYANLLDELEALEAEHARRRPAPAVAIATAVLALGAWPHEEDQALRILERYLPLGAVARGVFGGSPQDHKNDFPQILRVACLDLARKCGGKDLLRRLYEAHPSLVYLPNDAFRDFLDGRRRAKQDALDEQHRDDEEPGEGEATECRETEEAEGVEGMSVERLEQAVTAAFRHSPTDRRILHCLLTADLNPLDHGYTVKLAAAAVCCRKTVSHYLSRLLRLGPGINFCLLSKICGELPVPVGHQGCDRARFPSPDRSGIRTRFWS